MSPTNPPLPPQLLARIRELRKNATEPEQLLWQLLRNRALQGYKFRRQHPCEGYILDFYCHQGHLAIELDGSGHLEAEQERYDLERTAVIEKAGIHVIRFWNHEVMNDTQLVLEVIWEALTTPEKD